MAASPFFWGTNGQKLSPAQVESLRAVAEARGTRPVAQNLGEGLGAIGDALVVNAYQGKANKAETEGQQLVADALAAKDWTGVLGNEWSSPGQRAVGSAMMDRGWQLEDRSANWAHDESLANRSRQWSLDDRAAEWGREDPLRALQIESGRLELDRTKAGYHNLITPEERAAAGIPAEDMGIYQVGPTGQLEPVGGKGGQTINVSTGGGTDDFYKKLDTDAGEQQAALLDAGRNATSNNMRLGKLSDLLSTAPQGASGIITQFAGSIGIPMEGLNEVQAAQALINQMVPGQRPPGSGTMSDADLILFKASLPAIINQPGGNARILATAQLINNYTIDQAKIAEKVANREITPAEGRAQQSALPNPLADIKPPRAAGTAPDGVPADVWGAMTPQEKALWD